MDFFEKLAEKCMPFLWLLREGASSFFDTLFSIITHLGEETVFLVLAIFIFWCVNKRAGYYVLLSGLFGTVLNQFLKLLFRVPRPWVIDPAFKDMVVADAIPEATGYSFPSGHTQNTATTFGAIASFFRKSRVLIVICALIIALVSFSRMYLGVHTPLDVSVSLIVSAVLVFGFYPIFSTEARFKKCFPYLVVSAAIVSILYFVYVLSVAGDATLDSANYHSALKNACTLLGCTVGLIAVYFVDGKWTNFKTEAKWYAQIIKLALGLCGVLIIKSGLSSPLTALFGNEMTARAVRYFLIVVFAGCVWPLTFSRFSSMKIAALDRFGEKVVSALKRK